MTMTKSIRALLPGLILLLLLFVSGCAGAARPLVTSLSEVEQSEVIVVGKIVLDPPLEGGGTVARNIFLRQWRFDHKPFGVELQELCNPAYRPGKPGNHRSLNERLSGTNRGCIGGNFLCAGRKRTILRHKVGNLDESYR